MIRLYDWLWLGITWAGLLLAVAGLLVAADWWKSRHDVG